MEEIHQTNVLGRVRINLSKSAIVNFWMKISEIQMSNYDKFL